LKYIIYCITSSTAHEFKDRLVIELVDLDVAANNLNLPKIVSSVLGPKLLRKNNMIKNEIHDIDKQMRSQKLFADHTWDDAWRIVRLYFDENERDLSKEVFKISEVYEQVFRPYRVVYNIKTWQPVVFWLVFLYFTRSTWLMDEYQIVERVKDRYRTGSINIYDNLLLNDTTIISDQSYKRLYQHNPSISKQVIGYVYDYTTNFVSTLEFPILQWNHISYAYIYKKGYVIREDSPFGPAPLPNLKYIIYCITSSTEDTGITAYEFKDRLVIELVDLDIAANNLNLPKIVSSVLGPKLLSENNMIERDVLDEVVDRTRSQKLFADHTWYDAWLIMYLYFDTNKRDLSKEVLKISQAYERVFRPYRVVYDAETWQPVLM